MWNIRRSPVVSILQSASVISLRVGVSLVNEYQDHLGSYHIFLPNDINLESLLHVFTK
jgi:hypothetical protein